MNIAELARQYASWFETATRPDGTDFIRLKTEDEQLKQLIYIAHDEMMPDDFKYQFIHDALELISETDNIDDIYLETDIYNSDLLKWVSSNLLRSEYVNQAVSEYGYHDFFRALRDGQALEKFEVLQSVRSSLEEILEDA